MLFDRVAETVQVLDVADLDRAAEFPGAVGERYATWTRCARGTCTARIFDSQSDSITRIPTVGGRPQYAPVVDEATETVFFVRSGFRCGRGVRILSAPLATMTDTTVVLTLPRGIDTEWEMSLGPNPVSGTDLWFGRYRCRANDGDVYVIRDVYGV